MAHPGFLLESAAMDIAISGKECYKCRGMLQPANVGAGAEVSWGEPCDYGLLQLASFFARIGAAGCWN